MRDSGILYFVAGAQIAWSCSKYAAGDTVGALQNGAIGIIALAIAIYRSIERK